MVLDLSYSYDANGNQIRWLKERRAPAAQATAKAGFGGGYLARYEYDAFNRMTAAFAGGAAAHYAYRADGQRRSKEVGGVTTAHLWDGGQIVADIAGDAPVATYIRGAGLACSDTVAGRGYCLYNGHGDVTGITDAAGAIARRYDYSAFGIERAVAGYDPSMDANPFRYAGEYFDANTSTYYLRARNYRPTAGRFLTEDSIRDGMNWYIYCYQNPIMYADSNGNKPYSIKSDNGKYSLDVTPQWFDVGIDVAAYGVGALGAIAFGPLGGLLGVGYAGFIWAALRAVGYREIGGNGITSDALGAAINIAGGLSSNPFVKKLGEWVPRTIDFANVIKYAYSWLFEHKHQIEEAIFNQFDSNIWLSATRDLVDAKFDYAVKNITNLIVSGRIEVRKAVDVFGKDAFSDGMTKQFDPLTGKYRYYYQNQYYFFALDGNSSISYISHLEESIKK
jgi:RHS repeat-associated protein